MRAVYLILLFAPPLSLALQSTVSMKEPVIPIFTDSTTTDFFPVEWMSDEVKARSQPVTLENAQRSEEALKSAFKQYPAELLEKNLRSLKITVSLNFFDVPYSGTNSLDAVYIVAGELTQGYTPTFIVETFHHELSSILFRNHSDLFKTSEWLEQNPTHFRYLGGGTAAIREGKASEIGHENLFEGGFLTEYSKASLEEDINVLAGRVMTAPQEIKSIIANHPRIKIKFEIWLSFMKAIHRDFRNPLF